MRIRFFVTSVVVTYVLASVFQSLFVLATLEGTGVDIPLAAWLRAVAYDLYGLTFGGYVPYGLMVLVGFLIAFPFAALVRKFLNLPQWLVYPLAGGTAMATMLYLIDINFFDGTMHAGTRGWMGFACQLLAGSVGGAVFAMGSRSQS